MTQHDIELRELRPNGSRMFELSTEHGFALLSLNTSGWLCVSDIEVAKGHLREGIGTALLARTTELSQALGASVIYAGIVTREAVELFTKFFGDSVSVEQLGTFTAPNEEPRNDARAMLWHVLPRQE